MGQCIVRDRRVLGTDFAPGNALILVGIEPEREIEITQRDVPLAGDLLAGDFERKITVAGFMRECQRADGNTP